MSDILREKLLAEMDHTDWAMLKPHQARNSVLVVSPLIDLVDVGIAVASDDVDKIKSLQLSKDLRPPTPAEVVAWNQDDKQKFAKMIIVQPFVLIQLSEALH